MAKGKAQDVVQDPIHNILFWTCPHCKHRNSTQPLHWVTPLQCEECHRLAWWKPSESKIYIG